MMVVIRSMFSLPHVIDWHCRHRCYRVGDCQPMNLMPVPLLLPVEEPLEPLLPEFELDDPPVELEEEPEPLAEAVERQADNIAAMRTRRAAAAARPHSVVGVAAQAHMAVVAVAMSFYALALLHIEVKKNGRRQRTPTRNDRQMGKELYSLHPIWIPACR